MGRVEGSGNNKQAGHPVTTFAQPNGAQGDKALGLSSAVGWQHEDGLGLAQAQSPAIAAG